MSRSQVDDALLGYMTMRRALLTSTASRWRDLDISMQQLRAIYIVHDEEVATVGRLAEVFHIGLPAASVLADRLVRGGFVERRDDPQDRRRVLLSLTRSGMQLVAELREGSSRPLRKWMAELPAEDLAALSRGWRALAQVASRHTQPLEKSAV